MCAKCVSNVCQMCVKNYNKFKINTQIYKCVKCFKEKYGLLSTPTPAEF